MLKQIEAENADAPTRVKKYVEQFLQTLKHGGKICLCGMLASDYATLPEKVRVQIRDFFTENEAWLAKVLEQGKKSGDREIVIESHSFSRLVVEETEEKEAEKILTLPNVAASPNRRVTTSLFAVSGFSVLLALTFGVYQYFSLKKTNLPFEKIKFTRLTNSGKVKNATISPDGKYIAYVSSESEGNSIWIQQVGTASDVRLLAPVKAEVYELTFNPDGSYIYYSLFASGDANLKSSRISSLGGISEQIYDFNAGYITFAPDGKRFAYAQSDAAAGQNYLMIADADGGNQQIISTKKYPNTFVTEYPMVSWSPDGEMIACLVQHTEGNANYFSIIGINSKDGSERLLSAGELV